MPLCYASAPAPAALYIAERQMRLVVGDQQQALLSSVAAYIDQDLDGKRQLLASVSEQLGDADLRDPHRTHTLLALAYLDIDHFKRINDTLGHGVGDRVLVEFARRLKDAVRATDTVARLAGDEFVVIFENLTDPRLPEVMGEKILAAMRSGFELEGTVVLVNASVGIAIGTTQGATMAYFLATADAALYTAKEAWRGRFSVRNVEQPDVTA